MRRKLYTNDDAVQEVKKLQFYTHAALAWLLPCNVHNRKILKAHSTVLATRKVF